jgi:prepilin-type N-terminal cleavage/methylation domain-containing protein
MKTHTTSLKAKFNSAFSLVELLVVIAVIAVIAAIAIPNITGARDAAVQAQTDYDDATVERLVNQAIAAGATNPSVPDAAGMRGGTVYSNAQGIVFQLQ